MLVEISTKILVDKRAKEKNKKIKDASFFSSILKKVDYHSRRPMILTVHANLINIGWGN